MTKSCSSGCDLGLRPPGLEGGASRVFARSVASLKSAPLGGRSLLLSPDGWISSRADFLHRSRLFYFFLLLFGVSEEERDRTVGAMGGCE